MHERERRHSADHTAEIAGVGCLHGRAIGHARREVHDALHLSHDRRGIVCCERCRRAASGRHAQLVASSRVVAGIHVHEVRAGRLDVRLDRGLGTVAKRHHRHDGADADDHPEHGEKRAQLVAAERLERNPETCGVVRFDARSYS